MMFSYKTYGRVMYSTSFAKSSRPSLKHLKYFQIPFFVISLVTDAYNTEIIYISFVGSLYC